MAWTLFHSWPLQPRKASCLEYYEQAASSQVHSENEWWWRPIKEGDPDFKSFYRTQYAKRS